MMMMRSTTLPARAAPSGVRVGHAAGLSHLRSSGMRTRAAQVLTTEAPAQAATEPDASAAPSAPTSTETTPSPAVTGDVKGPMLEPSVANKGWVRGAAGLAALALAAGGTAFLPSRIAAFVHITAFGVWLGSNIWNTFFVGLTMFKHMPRQTFGRVQSALFPQYFTLTTGCNVLLLASLLLAPAANPAATQSAAITLGAALACSIGNMLFVEPIATKLMFQRYDLENKPNKTEEDKASIQSLYKQFGKFHGISSLLNLLITCAAISHGWFLGGALGL